MKSFVTGATGFVGCHVVRHLLAAGDSVRVLVRPASNLRALEGQPVEFAEGDLRDGRSLDAALHGIDRVFHVAADYRLWSARPEEMYESNVGGTQNMLQSRATRWSEPVYLHQHGGHRSGSPGRVAAERTDPCPGRRNDRPLQAFQVSGGTRQPMKAASSRFSGGDRQPYHAGGSAGLEADAHRTNRGGFSERTDAGVRRYRIECGGCRKMWPPGILLAAERGRSGERYILGARNMTLKEILERSRKLPAGPRRGCVYRISWRWLRRMWTVGFARRGAAIRRFRWKA